ncbi:hypothetical protein tb265_00790 [Gemmatimonadetes bacterium T265]|nr:hypothetical protein tb265_00790 [Gemmatimonadetes bacterium T265]
MSVAPPNRRAWVARGTRAGALASTLAILAACADSITPTAPVTATGPSLSSGTASTAAVPDVVRRVRIQTTTGKASPGYVLTAVTLGDTLYAVAFDTTGTVVYYRSFPGVTGNGDAYVQPNGDFTLFLGATNGWQPLPGAYTEFRTSGALVRQWSAPSGYYNDQHELRVGTGSNPTYLFGYDYKAMDFTSRGGKPDSVVAGHTIFSVDAGGNAKPVFVSRDHFSVADWIDPQVGVGDYDHPNSIDVDTDNDLLISWRNFDEVSKIDPNTGQFVWRLGGRHNQFTFVNDPLNGFGGQHFVRRLANGNILLYDNGTTHSPQESRAAEYRVDPVAHTATLVWQYRHSPRIYTPFVGSVQRLASGNTFIGYAYVGTMAEVTPGGSVAWEGKLTVDGKVTLAYRLLKYTTLGHFRP